MTVLVIERVDVSPGRVEALVRVPEGEPVRTRLSLGLAERALALLPGLRRHTCENGSAHGIAAELADTETPHLLEHVAFELMALSGSPRTLRGETAWDFSADGRGVFRVRLGYDDDLVALGALRAAVGVCEWLLLPDAAEKPDVEATVTLLSELRARGTAESANTREGLL
jgi:cyanophycin synthetase